MFFDTRQRPFRYSWGMRQRPSSCACINFYCELAVSTFQLECCENLTLLTCDIYRITVESVLHIAIRLFIQFMYDLAPLDCTWTDLHHLAKWFSFPQLLQGLLNAKHLFFSEACWPLQLKKIVLWRAVPLCLFLAHECSSPTVHVVSKCVWWGPGCLRTLSFSISQTMRSLLSPNSHFFARILSVKT